MPRKEIPYECITCEVTDPDLFYTGRKTMCKACVRDKRSNAYHNKSSEEKALIAEKQIQWQNDNFFAKLANSTRTRAIKKGWQNEMTTEYLEELYEKQHGLCYLTGLPLEIKTRHMNSLSIDRYDSSGGYTKDNVRLCVRWVNVMKNTHSYEDFIILCEIIVRYSQMLKGEK